MKRNDVIENQLSVLNGLILAGGKSSRMGYDKSLIQYHVVSQREYLFNLLKSFCATVFTSCKATNDIPSNFNPLPDRFDLDSPLNGILTAFSYDANSAWVTVPVDMPLIDENVISYLLNNRDAQKVATCFFDSDGKDPEPMLTVWEPSAHPLLLDFYDAGNISPRDFLKHEKVNLLEIPNRLALVNINSPEELEKFKASQNQSL